ncbi:MAG: hypothetical protein ACR2KV_05140 [Solirubrobacteraceae bacterium]
MPFPVPTIGRSGLFRAILALLAIIASVAAPAVLAAPAATFTAPDDPSVPALISSLRGCLSRLAPADRRLLTLRSGLGGHAPRLTAAVAAGLGIAPAAASAAEVTAIRRLEGQRRAGACQPMPTAAATHAATPAAPAQPKARAKPPTSTPTRTAATPPPARAPAASGSSTTGVLEVVIPGLLVLAFFAGISIEMLRHRRP